MSPAIPIPTATSLALQCASRPKARDARDAIKDARDAIGDVAA